MNIIKYGDDNYPELLGEIYKAPDQLYYRGDTDLLKRRKIAVVGSRNATDYGISVAKKIGEALGNAGVTVVSGMAYGIDMAAHQGAVDTRGGTIAVLGSAIDMEKSKGKEEIFREISGRGLVLSEYSPGTPPARYTFPERNRIISGLAEAVVVVQGGFNSGSLITAELALEQGRKVYAVPGDIDREQSLGVNKLIMDGAVPLVTIQDILVDMNIMDVDLSELGPDEERIYRYIYNEGEITLNVLAEKTGMKKKYLAKIVSLLEIKGFCDSYMGRIFVTDRGMQKITVAK